MPFWSTNFGEDTTLKDPKRKFRFTVEFQGIQAAQGGSHAMVCKNLPQSLVFRHSSYSNT